MTEIPRLLILSFSPIARDARVMKQVRRFVPQYRVTTCGFGPAPEGVVDHIRIPDDQPEHDLNGRLITLRLYKQAYWSLSAVRWAKGVLNRGDYDIVLANDVESVPLALSLSPRGGVHADLHEYSPRLHDEQPAWRRRIRPFYEWLCRRYVSRADSWSTVGAGLAREYERVFGFAPVVVTNAAPFAGLTPSEVTAPVRIVHSGACLRNRHIHDMVDAVIGSVADVTLDLYLTPNDPQYLEELKQLAAVSDRVTVNDPVAYDDLITVLNNFDLGIHFLPPINFNNEWALPNKLFDYVQARLGVLVGPSAEMARYVREFELGVVARDFTLDALRAAVDGLSVERVEQFKAAADSAASELAADREIDVWQGCLEVRAESLYR